MLISYERANNENFGRQVATVTNEVATSANLPLGAELQVLSLSPEPGEKSPVMLGALVTHAPKIHELEIHINDPAGFNEDELQEFLEELSEALPEAPLARYTVYLVSPGIEDHWEVLIDVIANHNTNQHTKLRVQLGMACFGDRDTIEGLFDSLSQQNAFSSVHIETSEIDGDAIHDDFITKDAAQLLSVVAGLTFTNSALTIHMELPMTTFASHHTEMQKAFNRALTALVGPRAISNPDERSRVAMSFNPDDYTMSMDDEEDNA